MTEAQHARPAPVPAAEPPRQAPPASWERTWATFCHLAAFSALFRIPLGLIVGPLVVWLIKKNESRFVDGHGKAALNFQLSMVVYGAGAMAIGSWLLPAVFRALWGYGIRLGVHGGLIHLGALPVLGHLALWFPLLVAIIVLDVAATIVAAVRANAGRPCRYPFAIPFLR